MCGFLLTNLAIDDAIGLRALAALRHRGPDHCSAIVRAAGHALAHARLRVVGDPELGNQPWFSPDGRHALVFNGEIYNYRELAHRHGIALASGTDSELLVELYRRCGPAFLPQLNGVFAFVILDTQTGKTFAARDRLGVKPLYRWRRGDGYAWASETAALRVLAGTDAVDPAALRQYRSMRGCFGRRTFFRDIESFPPGHCEIDGRTTAWWTLAPHADAPPSDDELATLLADAVALRLVADIEVGALLSGGLDSTYVALQAGVRRTWCAGFAGDADLAVAARIAGERQLIHRTVEMDAAEFLRTARAMIAARGEPLAVPNEVLLYRVATDAAAQGVRCLLTGEGADELFAGYDRIFRWAAAADRFDLAAFARHYCYDRADDLEPVAEALAPYLHFGDPYRITSAFFQQEHLGLLLRRLDQATMLAGVEAREPFVDFRLVERLFALPLAWKIEGDDVKAPLRRVARRVVPDYVATRRKLGFPVPLAQVFPGGRGYPDWLDFNLAALGWHT